MTLRQRIDDLVADAALIRAWVTGGPTTSVNMGAQVVRSPARLIAENQASITAATGQVQNSTPQWLTNVTGTSAITANANPPITAYVAGQTFRFMWPHPAPSAGPLTLNINGLGALQIVLEGGGPVQLPPGAVVPWAIIEVVFNGVVFQLTNSTIATQALRLRILNISNQNLNTITQAGQYDGELLSNAPLGINGWWYIEVIRHTGFVSGTHEWVMQRATGLNGAHQGRVFVRTSGAPANWTAWREQTSAASIDPSALPTAVLGSGTADATTFLRGDRTHQPINAAVASALNASGSAPIFACRAWVNFDGTGTVAIRASGNVSSITDNGVGHYTVNFTTAMPSAGYAVTQAISNGVGAQAPTEAQWAKVTNQTATAFQVFTHFHVNNAGHTPQDSPIVMLAVFH